jgi:hypothetical protein
MGEPFWIILISVSLFLGVTSVLAAVLVASKRKGTPMTPDDAQANMLNMMNKLGVKLPDNPNLFIPISSPTPTSGRLMSAMLVILLILLVDAGGAYFGWHADLRAHQLLRSEGKIILAEITDRYVEENDDSSDDYFVVYDFQARGKDGMTAVFSKKVEVDNKLYGGFIKGGTVEIIYAPSDPTISRITALDTPDFPRLSPGTIITSVLGVIGLLVLLGVFGSYRNALRLDTDGVTVTAHVVDLSSNKDSEGSNTYYMVCQLENSRTIRNSISKTRYNLLSSGNILRVRYLVEKPEVYRVEWES